MDHRITSLAAYAQCSLSLLGGRITATGVMQSIPVGAVRHVAGAAAARGRCPPVPLSGKPNKQIVFDLGVSEGTVKSHVNSIFQKLGCGSRTEADATTVCRGFLRL